MICHNDLFTQNILLLPDERIMIIDNEYSAPNYLGVDVLNFFIESCITYDSREFDISKFDSKKFIDKNTLENYVNFYFENLN